MPTKKQRDRLQRFVARTDRLKDKIMQAVATEMKRNGKLDDRHVRAALHKACQIETNFQFVQIKYGGETDERRPRLGDSVRHKKVPKWGKGIIVKEDDFGFVVTFPKGPDDGNVRVGFLDLKLV